MLTVDVVSLPVFAAAEVDDEAVAAVSAAVLATGSGTGDIILCHNFCLAWFAFFAMKSDILKL